MKRYCVTAINRLTGEREILTPPCSSENADNILLRLSNVKSKNRPYTHPRKAEYPKQLNLFTQKVDV